LCLLAAINQIYAIGGPRISAFATQVRKEVAITSSHGTHGDFEGWLAIFASNPWASWHFLAFHSKWIITSLLTCGCVKISGKASV